MDFIDMFAGMGTARMGFEKAGHKCVYSIEWDKHKRKIYEVIFGHEPDANDIRQVRGSDLPKSDCWTAGFPCQDISVAGKQLGFKGHRSSLFFAVTGLIREMPEENRPSYLLFENVKNFFSVNNGYDFLTALIELDEIGYDCEWQLLNSKHFGVPQNRERVFIVGHLRGRSTRKVFPITGSNGENLKQLVGGSDAQRVYNSNGIARTLKAEGGGQGAKTGLYVVGQSSSEGSQAGKVYSSEGLFPTICAGTHGYAMGNVQVKACLTPDRIEKRQNGRRFKEDGEPMFTLTKQDIHGVAISNEPQKSCESAIKQYEKFINKNNYIPEFFNPYNCREISDISPTLTQSCDRVNASSTVLKYDGTRIRRLTPRECMRLQGIEDYITNKLIEAGISDTQMYRAAGDAWTVNVGYEIAVRMSVD